MYFRRKRTCILHEHSTLFFRNFLYRLICTSYIQIVYFIIFNVDITYMLYISFIYFLLSEEQWDVTIFRKISYQFKQVSCVGVQNWTSTSLVIFLLCFSLSIKRIFCMCLSIFFCSTIFNDHTQDLQYSKNTILKTTVLKNCNLKNRSILKLQFQKLHYSKTTVLKNRITQNLQYSITAVVKKDCCEKKF